MFLVEEDPEWGFSARALGVSIFMEADDPSALRKNVLNAVRCHYPTEEGRPKVVRLHHVRYEVLAL